MELSFTKSHGLGNDFIIINCLEEPYKSFDFIKYAKNLCDRNTGIGADGLLLVCKSDIADLKMRIINSDGSEAEMCGNGIRCFAKYAFDKGIVNKYEMDIETLDGIKHISLFTENGETTVRVNMGKALFDKKDIPMLGEGECMEQKITVLGKEMVISAVHVGIPHTIVLVDNIDLDYIRKYGSAIETHKLFPEGTNVNFVVLIDKTHIKMRTFERGCGITLACGTGASSSVACLNHLGLTENKAFVELEKGTLEIECMPDGTVFMTGKAETAFEGNCIL